MRYVMLALLVGCKPDPVPPPSPDLAVASAGAEPRRPLRYALAKGTTSRLELVTDVTLEAGKLGGPMPTFVLDLELTAEAVLPDGRMMLRTTIVDATVRDRPGSAIVAASLADGVAKLKGVAIAQTLSPDGHTGESRVELGGRQLPDAVAQELGVVASSLDRMTMPLPAVPVGFGARWTSTRALDQTGIKLDTVTTVDVTGLDGTRLTYHLDSQVRGADQRVTQAGAQVDVTKIGGTATGRGTIDLSTLSYTGEFTAEFHNTMAMGDEPTPISLTTAATIRPLP